jgi:uncharacterized integral membrane protein
MSNVQPPGDVPPQGVPSGSPPQPGVHPTSQPPAEEPGRHFSTGQLLGGILFVLVVVFVLENTRSVKVRLWIPEVTVPLAVPILIAAVLGALVAWLLRYRRHRRGKGPAARP